MLLYNPTINSKPTPPPKISTYRVEKNGYPTFDILVKEIYSYNSILYNITVGKNKEKCINISFHKNINIYPGKDESHIAEMGWVEHYKGCSIDDNLPKGDFGTKHLVRSVFEFIKDNYKWITIINLFDGSYFICKNQDKTDNERKVMLAPYNIALYDGTWYENNFKAYLNNNMIYNKYKEAIKQLTNQNEKLNWTSFFYKYKIDENIDIIEKYYTSSETYRDFFISLKNDDKERYCWRISKWIQYFISDILENINIDKWYIDLDKIPEYDIKVKHIKTDIEKSYRGGRKKKTRRIKKLKKLPPGFNQTEFDLEYNDHWPYD